MKKPTVLICVCFIILFVGSFKPILAQHNYVVIGSFSKENRAQKFVGYARSKFFNAQYDLNVERNFYYVFITRTDDVEEAHRQANRVRTETEFKDTWVYEGKLAHDNDEKPILDEGKIPPLAIAEDKKASDSKTSDSLSHENAVVDAPVKEQVAKHKIKGQLFKFIVNTDDDKPVEGEIHWVDFDAERDLASYKLNQYVDISNPAMGKPLTLVCGIFGYREVTKEINYAIPGRTPGALKDENGAWIIPYQLQRLGKGDVSVMYHVSFYKDAVVMLPTSQEELNELVNMMKSNTNYKIRIHGHCNGKNDRKIIAIGAHKNYFNVEGSDEYKGTAKTLSKLRGEAIQSYLLDNGIEKDRTSVYAWGGQDMLVPETSPSAKLNDRVEIEILKD